MKKCYKCLLEKEETFFTKDKTKLSGLDDWCKDCKREKRKISYEKNKQTEINKNKEYQIKNRKQINKRRNEHYHENNQEMRNRYALYYLKNKEKVDRRHAIYCKNRYQTDIEYKLRCVTSRIMGYYLKQNGGSKRCNSVLKYLPYTIQQLKQHLENLFSDWMDWGNYGIYEYNKKKWHIDHIIPQSKLAYDSMEHPNFQKCWALENLRPLEAIENIKKGNRDV